MKGEQTRMMDFMEGSKNRYVIPVYQRKYSWKHDNCRQLYDDLKRIVRDGRNSHFFGSIVADLVGSGSKVEYHVIDGQQRLTTVTLLLLAMRNVVAAGKVHSTDKNLVEKITEEYLIDKWGIGEDSIKLRPVKGDKQALFKLFGDPDDYDRSSNLTYNYEFFYDLLLKEEIPIADLFEAVGKLEIILITLERDDEAQLIFESLNSTGLALTEGDKIRNYVLMGLSAVDQTKYYEMYWAKIEKCTDNDVSSFVRDYLSIKEQATPNMNQVYQAFKSYAEKKSMPIEELLSDLLAYARHYEKLLTNKSGLGNKQLDDCLYRLHRLDLVVTRPFMMEVLHHQQKGLLTADDVLQVFTIIETYLFRRNICDVATNGLNKVLVNLNKEILRYDGTTNDYVDKCIYTLLLKRGSGLFPTDEAFTANLHTKEVYLMRGKYKDYLFERFENFGTIEAKDVYTHLDNNVYSIEHIMPQHMSPAWKESLGSEAEEIHNQWLHRLANLTLTAYNPSLSNNTFLEKRDAEEVGYRNSGLRMNQKIAMKDTWGLAELEERNAEMVAQALKIWPYPTSDFVPVRAEVASFTLDDEEYDSTGRKIFKYGYQGAEQPVASWSDMFEHILKYLHAKDPSVLMSLAYGSDNERELSVYVSHDPSDLRIAFFVGDKLYFEKNMSTERKLSVLRKLFIQYDADPTQLVFYLRDKEQEEASNAKRHEYRSRYWAFALPIIQKGNERLGAFENGSITHSNTLSGYFGISGFSIRCIANYDSARVELYLGSSNIEKNKTAFDYLLSHKVEIESALGAKLEWFRADDKMASWINYTLDNVSITDEADWSRMAKFHSEWSNKICSVMLNYLWDDREKRLQAIAEIFREWATLHSDITIHIDKSNRTYTRFTTPSMSELLPDTPNAPSGWNTDNHYFYEIVSRSGDSAYISFVLSSENLSHEQRIICDKIQVYYPSKRTKSNWLWRAPYKTSTFTIDESLNKSFIFNILDNALQEVWAFEKDLIEKLNS